MKTFNIRDWQQEIDLNSRIGKINSSRNKYKPKEIIKSPKNPYSEECLKNIRNKLMNTEPRITSIGKDSPLKKNNLLRVSTITNKERGIRSYPLGKYDKEGLNILSRPISKVHDLPKVSGIVVIDNKIKRENIYAITGFCKNNKDVERTKREYHNARQRWYYKNKKAEELSETKHRTAEDVKRLNSA